MIWFEFAASTILLVIAATRLSYYGDVIAVRTGLGAAFVGTLLLAGATSLPELLTSINSIGQGEPELSVGNFFGSSMFNMALIGIMDLVYRQGRLLKRVAVNHALTAGLAVLLTTLAVFFMQANVSLRIGWIGVDSLIIIGFYVLGTYLIQQNNRVELTAEAHDEPNLQGLPSLRRAAIGFGLATVVLVVVTPLLVSSSIEIAVITGLSTGFVGAALLAIVTSLPEAVTTIAAVRLKAYDLAIGNLFGSNIFNIFALGLSDLFYTQGALFNDLDASLGFAGLLAVIMISLALIGNLSRVERRLGGILELDAVLIIVTYLLGLVLLYGRGMGV